jgi:type II secretion system protein G
LLQGPTQPSKLRTRLGNLHADRAAGGLVILVLLASLVAPRVIGYLGSSHTKAAKVQIQSLSTALELYKVDTGRYPTTSEGLKALIAVPPGGTSWNGPYLTKKEVPSDPWGRPYTYRSPGEHAPFEITSLGADNQPVGTGENEDSTSWHHATAVARRADPPIQPALFALAWDATRRTATSRWTRSTFWCRSRACASSAGIAAVMTDATPFLPGLSSLGRKPLTAEQDAGNLTSNGGLLVLRESALRSEVAAVVADAVPDRRNPLLVTHSYRAMVTARMMAIAAGYEDADDLDALRFDPALMLACNREPEGGHGLPSQPTISRLENVPDGRTVYRIGIGYIGFLCRSYATPPNSIVLDIDDTDDLVHRQQGLALFNTPAGGYCFQPIHIFEGNSGKPILSLLRPGKRPAARRSRACSGT